MSLQPRTPPTLASPILSKTLASPSTLPTTTELMPLSPPRHANTPHPSHASVVAVPIPDATKATTSRSRIVIKEADREQYAALYILADGERCCNLAPRAPSNRCCLAGWHPENKRQHYLDEILLLQAQRTADEEEELQRQRRRQELQARARTSSAASTSSSTASVQTPTRRPEERGWGAYDVDKWWVGQWNLSQRRGSQS
ncbi:hypothetical protein P7C73_g2545, partial [Tremellales sp. Uapishka_1]